MCFDPVSTAFTIGSAVVKSVSAHPFMSALTVGSAGAKFLGDTQRATQQAAFERAQSDQVACFKKDQSRLANQGFIDHAFQVGLRQQQEDLAANRERRKVQIEAAKQRARLKVSAGEAGFAGVSLNNLLRDAGRQESFAQTNIDLNRQMSRLQSVEETRALRASAISKVASVEDYVPSPVQRPNLFNTVFSTGLQLGTLGK